MQKYNGYHNPNDLTPFDTEITEDDLNRLKHAKNDPMGGIRVTLDFLERVNYDPNDYLDVVRNLLKRETGSSDIAEETKRFILKRTLDVKARGYAPRKGRRWILKSSQ
jgi:hypothetical protein